MSGAGWVVGIVMGSQSDWETMQHAAGALDRLNISYETRIVSAHRTPERLYEYGRTARSRGLRAIIAGAGGAAHLPGMIAALMALPVLGVPIESRNLKGIDSLLSIVQMPAGIPVATFAIGQAGAVNAALFAAAILALLFALVGAMLLGLVLEFAIFRHLFGRDHLDQVLATFGVILFLNEGVRIIWGSTPLSLPVPEALSGSVTLMPGLLYPVYRLAIVASGVGVAALLYVIVNHTRIGMLVRAGAANAPMVSALGVDVGRLFMIVFGLASNPVTEIGLDVALTGRLFGPKAVIVAGLGAKPKRELILDAVS